MALRPVLLLALLAVSGCADWYRGGPYGGIDYFAGPASIVPAPCLAVRRADPRFLPPGCALGLQMVAMAEDPLDLVRPRLAGSPAALPVGREAERYLAEGPLPLGATPLRLRLGETGAAATSAAMPAQRASER